MIRELEAGETGLAHLAIAELRPAYADADDFVRRFDREQRPDGCRLLASFDEGEEQAAAAAVLRRIRNLAWGDVLYVDDLSTRASHRRRGHGAALLEAVALEAVALGCEAVHLDSGHQRHEAHRLYLASGYRMTSHHFVRSLT